MSIARDVTFCIKTIARPWGCARLVRSIHAHLDGAKIIVADDGPKAHRFSEKYPQDAARCQEVINIDTVDVGVGAGRNAAVDAVETELFFLFDDDHVVTESLDMPLLMQRFQGSDIDILSVRQGKGGKPHMLTPIMDGQRIWVHKGERRRQGPLAWCDMGSNAFLARAETITQGNRWDDSIKIFEHWEFFYRASRLNGLKVCVATDCSVKHRRVKGSKKIYQPFRDRSQFRSLGLKKHGFRSMRGTSGGIFHA